MATEQEKLQVLVDAGVGTEEDEKRLAELKKGEDVAEAPGTTPPETVTSEPTPEVAPEPGEPVFTFGIDQIPDDTYKVHGTSSLITTGAGVDKVVVRWVIQEGEYAGTDISDFYDLSVAAQFRIKNTLRGLGLIPADKPVKLTLDKIIGLLDEVNAEIAVSWDAKFARMKVDGVYKPGTIESAI